MTATGGHRPLFIRDITSAWQLTKNQNDASRSSSQGKPERVRINGVIVLDKYDSKTGERRIWVDDSTDTICVVLNPRLCRRPDAKQLRMSVSVTLFGTVDRLSLEKLLVVRCGGFHIEHDLNMEIYHWIRALAVNGGEEDATTLMPPITIDNDRTTAFEPPLRDKEIEPHKQQPSFNRLFQGQHQSLLSQPSPTRGPTTHLLQSQLSITDDDLFNDFGDSDQWNWSPDHAVASSTPITRVQNTTKTNDKGSPLRAQLYPADGKQLNEDYDSFGFDSSFDAADLDALEKDAIQTRNSKRPFDAID
ncbi:hypothetical protein O0I10_008897 [Lichtheimia ornata]|uniref:Uncharacterized protein n=1 Tax=Lichtheimia ornata TaxID=688661 RepID=A0AAD7UY34_9FUNG|nr:uncharacterized protein O0I10_008897 [Lichtheimia ornata]KAJ8655405.1 hypothetical protein O0I10_008897 [Lichtheimia ornata]